MLKYFIIFLILNQAFYVNTSIPDWSLSGQSVDLMSSTNSYDYIIYQKTAYDTKVILKKTITKSNGIITTQNYVTIGSDTKPVSFNDIDSHYKNKLGKTYLICPKGKFHPYDFNSGTHISQPSGFDASEDWDLKCYSHDKGRFFLFYLYNSGKNLYYYYNNNMIRRDNLFWSYLYDYKLENGVQSDGNYEYKFSNLRYEHYEGDGYYLILAPDVIIFNDGNGDVNKNCIESWVKLAPAKNFISATFDSSHKFYYLSCSDASDCQSGYSQNYVNFSSKEQYQSACRNINLKKNDESPLTFADDVEIENIKFISGTQYAYYIIKSKNSEQKYYGLIDIKTNKVLYNIKGSFTEFLPNPNSSGFEMLALTQTSAYKICINKADNSCASPCSNLVLENDGNKCQSGCSSGKIQLIPSGYCISSCDQNIYTLSSDGTKCGLCKDINSNNDNIYKLVNTAGCISSIPINTEFYHEDSKLLKCKNNYHLDTENNCVPDSCYERCNTCSEIGTSVEDQKCESCKGGYLLDNGNCIITPTTVIIPPTTVVIPPTTVIIPPTTVIVPPTTVIIPPTTVVIPPTTVVIPPTTVIIPPTTVIVPPTTVIFPPTTMINIPTTVILPPTTVIKPPTTEIIEEPKTQIPISRICRNERCDTCNEESNKKKLCLSCDESKYKKVNYTKNFSKYYDCLEEKNLEIKYYYDSTSEQYKPCFKLCKKCYGPGNVEEHNCSECEDNYMFRPGYNPNHNCAVYFKYYYLSAYNEYKPLDSPICPEVAKYKVIKEDKIYCIYDCKADETHKYLYDGNCFNECPNGTSNENYICKETDPEKIYISENEIFFKGNDTIETIESIAKSYATEFNYTNNHISTYNNDEYNLLIYKNPRIIGSTNLKAPDIDFGECYEDVKKTYNISENLIIAIADKKVNNNPNTFYLFFHPVSGVKLEIGDICQNKSIKMNENILEMLDEKSENYGLQMALTDQGINIFDINDPYYKDICYDFDNPQKRDMALKDRIKETYVDVKLCDDGCTNTGIDLKNKVASCDCKFNEVTNNDLIHENAALEYLVGEFFELVNSSNILVLKCYKYLLKYFTRSIGAIIILILFGLCILFTGVFFSYEFTKMKRYIFTLTEKYTSFIANYSNVFKLFPPKRKSMKNQTSKVEIIKFNDNKKISLHKNDKKQGTARTINSNSQSRQQNNSKDFMLSLQKGKYKLAPIKERPKGENVSVYLEEGRKIKRFFKEYLETLP